MIWWWGLTWRRFRLSCCGLLVSRPGTGMAVVAGHAVGGVEEDLLQRAGQVAVPDRSLLADPEALVARQQRAVPAGRVGVPAGTSLAVKRGFASLLRMVRLKHQLVEGTGIAVGVIKHQVACGVGADRQAE